jgi:hypothetical protein
VTQFPEGDLQDTAFENLISIWADQSVEQAGNYLSGLPTGKVRDVGIAALASKILPHSPETAAEWAMKITDNARRQQELVVIGESWLKSDPAAGRAWIKQAPLPPNEKAKLLASPT